VTSHHDERAILASSAAGACRWPTPAKPGTSRGAPSTTESRTAVCAPCAPVGSQRLLMESVGPNGLGRN